MLVHSVELADTIKISKLCTCSVKYYILFLMIDLSTYFCELVSPHCNTVLTLILLKNPLQQFQINTILSQTVISFYCVWSKVKGERRYVSLLPLRCFKMKEWYFLLFCHLAFVSVLFLLLKWPQITLSNIFSV